MGVRKIAFTGVSRAFLFNSRVLPGDWAFLGRRNAYSTCTGCVLRGGKAHAPTRFQRRMRGYGATHDPRFLSRQTRETFCAPSLKRASRHLLVRQLPVMPIIGPGSKRKPPTSEPGMQRTVTLSGGVRIVNLGALARYEVKNRRSAAEGAEKSREELRDRASNFLRRGGVRRYFSCHEFYMFHNPSLHFQHR